MRDMCDCKVVERMVNKVMVDRREEFMRSAQPMAALANKSVREGGSSESESSLWPKGQGESLAAYSCWMAVGS